MASFIHVTAYLNRSLLHCFDTTLTTQPRHPFFCSKHSRRSHRRSEKTTGVFDRNHFTRLPFHVTRKPCLSNQTRLANMSTSSEIGVHDGDA
ncbi:hypothetical protein Hanom_Chr17g01562531 [Helianthus anomalus]